MEGVGRGYLWRLRIPFDEFDNPRNYLSKVQNYAKVYDNVNSISHRGDFVSACTAAPIPNPAGLVAVLRRGRA